MNPIYAWWFQREWLQALKRRSEQAQRTRWICQAQTYRRSRHVGVDR